MKSKPQQLDVPGFGVWLKDCQRDAARLKGERSGKPLPLFDSLPNTQEEHEIKFTAPGRLADRHPEN